MNGGKDYPEYNCYISIPDNISGNAETKFVQETYNKIRCILGLKEIEI